MNIPPFAAYFTPKLTTCKPPVLSSLIQLADLMADNADLPNPVECHFKLRLPEVYSQVYIWQFGVSRLRHFNIMITVAIGLLLWWCWGVHPWKIGIAVGDICTVICDICCIS